MSNCNPDSKSPLVVVEFGVSVEVQQQLIPTPCVVSSADFAAFVAKAAGERDVICVAKDRDLVLRVSNIIGVVPIWITDQIRRNVLADASYAVIHDISGLSAYFESASADALLGLTRWRPSDTRAEIDRRIDGLLQAARVAGGITIYGAGTIGRQALDAARMMALPIKAILDADERLHGTQIDGIEVRPLSTIVPGVDVVVPSLGRHISSITRKLREFGVRDIMSLSELYYVSRRPGEPETDYLDDLFANRSRYHSLFLALADARSREVLGAVVKHRLSLATVFLADVAERGHPQWFDPAFLPRTDGDVFVDGGAYDGDTAIGYSNARGLDYRHIHAFEIDQDVAARAVVRTAHLPNVTIHNCGLSDREATVLYRKTGGTDGAIGDQVSGNNRVVLQTIDGTVAERITFLKLDVEGEEAKTIDGAKKHLREDRPTLAVALYHKAHDLWDIPRRILDLLPDYQLHLRHYTDIAYETVIYATPKSMRPGD